MHIPLDTELRSLFIAAADRAAAAYFAALPPPERWFTLPEAAAYAKMTVGNMRLLVLGRPYRAASAGKAERPAVLPRIERGDTGFAKGARVRQSAVDAYLQRHKYLNNVRNLR